MIKISVVIPARNRADRLPACLESVLSQTYPAAEVIVVDDASTDNTREIVESYLDRGVVSARLTNGKGAQAARNFGIKTAKHEWIAFQDSDDLWLEDKLALQVAALKDKEFSRDVVVHGNGLKRNDLSGEEIPIDVGPAAGNCYAQLLIQPGPMFPALLTSRSALEAIGCLDEDCSSHQEWDTVIRLAKQCKFVHIQQPLFIWVWHKDETISKDIRCAYLGFDYVIEKHKVEIVETHGIRAWRKLKVGNLAQALRASNWIDAKAMLAKQRLHPAFLSARLLAQVKFAPRGTGFVLRLLAT